MDMLYLHLHLIQSALGQKVEAEPGGNPRERSQGRPVMGGLEVASFPGETRTPMGQSIKRATPSLAEFDLSASFTTGRDGAHAVSAAPTPLALPASTPRAQHVRFTDEVPRRPVFGQVTLGYKSYTKSQAHASETGTALSRPRLKGCQQRQSRSVAGPLLGPLRSERQNLRVSPGPFRSMGLVSPALNATKWRGRTSSGQRVGSLSNSPLQPELGRVTVRSR